MTCIIHVHNLCGGTYTITTKYIASIQAGSLGSLYTIADLLGIQTSNDQLGFEFLEMSFLLAFQCYCLVGASYNSLAPSWD